MILQIALPRAGGDPGAGRLHLWPLGAAVSPATWRAGLRGRAVLAGQKAPLVP